MGQPNYYTLANRYADNLAEVDGHDLAESFRQITHDLIKRRMHHYGAEEIGVHEGMRMFRLAKRKPKRKLVA